MRDTRKLPLLGILIVSIALRVATALYLGDVVDAPPLMTDQRSYHALGARLISGYGFSFDKPWCPCTPGDTTWLHDIGRVGSFGLFLPFMLYGLYHVLRTSSLRGRSGPVLLFAACYSLLHLKTWAMVRYRLPVDAVTMPTMAGWAGVYLSHRASRILQNRCIMRRTAAGPEPDAFYSDHPHVGGS